MKPSRRCIGGGLYLLEFDSVDSTQDEARALYKYGERAIIGVRADYQRKGRGRSGAEWIAPPGTCLLVTYIVRLDDLSTAPELGMATGLAVAESIQEFCGLPARLKWPNDVLLNGRKAAGVLVETVGRGPDDVAALVGIGVNLNVETFPPGLEQRATSVRREGSREVAVIDYEECLRSAVFGQARDLANDGFAGILRQWRLRDGTAGRKYRAQLEQGAVEGIALGVSDSGALLIALDDGRQVETVSASAI